MEVASSKIYDVVSLRLPAEREELAAAELWSLGTLGWTSSEEGPRVRIDAWFSAPAPAEVVEEESLLWRRLGADLLEVRRLPGDDWMRGYRRFAQPFPVGRRFVVDPREPGSQPAAEAGGRALLRLPARQAFGVGSHESTRLAVELLEEMPLAGSRLLDLGSGTGILCLVALARGARLAVGVEIDPVATLAAGENRRLNAGLGERSPALVAGTLDCLAATARFAVVVANIIPSHLVPELPGLVARLDDGGSLVASGLLAVQLEEFGEHCAELGLEAERQRREGEWAAGAWRLGDRRAERPEA